MRPPEDRLFEKYRRKQDARLLAEVFDRTAPSLLRIARHTAPRRDHADDLLQQTFLIAIQQADRWDAEQALFPWLVGILVNQAKLLQRRESRQLDRERLRASTDPTPAAVATEARELEEAIAGAVAELGDTYRPVLHLHLFHSLNAKEIAKALDRPAGSVRTQLVRGLERLRRVLPVGLAVSVTVMAPALAAVRRTVLRHHLATLTAAGAGPTLVLFGSSMMKKWSLAVLAIVLVTFAVYPILPTAGDATDVPAPDQPEVAVAELEAQIANPPETNLPRERATSAAELAGRKEVDSPGASLLVRVVANENGVSKSIQGAWVALHTNQMRKPGEPRYGATTNAEGEVRFDDVPRGIWHALASVGAEGPRQSVQLEPGEQREVVLTSSHARFFDVAVVDLNGRPVADAEVWCGLRASGRIIPMQVHGRRAGKTGLDGKVHVAAGAGEFVGARKRGYMASRSSPAATNGGDAIVLKLRNDPGTVRGEVVYDTGEPVSGATVQVSPQSLGREADQAHRQPDGRTVAGPLAVLEHTDEYGRFEVTGLEPASYRIWTDAANRLHKGETVTVAAHDQKHVRLVVPRPAYVTGTVHRRDGTPADRIFIGVRQPHDDRVSPSGVVNKDGTFTFEVPRGPVTIVVWRKFGEALLEANAMAKARPQSIALTITDPESVSGRLLAEDETPVRQWIVGAVPTGTQLTDETVGAAIRNGRTTRSADDGTFTLYGCGEGPYTVFASPVLTQLTGPAPVRRDDVLFGTSGLELRAPDSVLERATLRLRVISRQGATVDNPRVQLFGGRRAQKLESIDGTFTQDRLVHGTYYLTIHASGHAGWARRITVDASETDLGDITLEPSGLLHVRPLRNGEPWQGPLPRPIVHDAVTGKRIDPQPTSTVVDGRLVLDGLPFGKFELRTNPRDDLLGEPVPVRLLPGPAAQVDWSVRIGRELTLRFPTWAKAGANDRLHVTVRDQENALVVERELTPDANGACLLRQVFAPGKYVVRVKRNKGQPTPGQSWQWFLDTARWRNGSTVDVKPLR